MISGDMLLCSKIPLTCLRYELVYGNPGGVSEARKDLCPQNQVCYVKGAMQVFDLGLLVTVRIVQI